MAFSAHASHAGVDTEKIAHAFEYETHPAFSDAERAALRLARHAALGALFGFLDRWNDTMSTQLEDVPRTFAEQHLAAGGWEVGKHC
jgi:alkylhydroperoxidase family enzyme